ncbi:MAG: hypothetical protein IPM29_05775 [Planctomycetes bacterium]|nr:hypothetical protein [Planctomycetota bacterium]
MSFLTDTAMATDPNLPPRPPKRPGPPGPPAAGPRAAAAAQQGLRGLDNEIDAICEPGQPGVLPFKAFSRPKKPYWPGGHAAVYGGGGTGEGPPVAPQIVARLLSAISSAKMSGDNGRSSALFATTTVRAFRQLGAAQQMNFVESVRNVAATAHPFSTPARQMYDPDYSTAPGNVRPLPTSWCPVTPGATVYHERLGVTPWKELCVGFRIDGSDEGSLQRVLRDGTTQQRLNEAFMLGRRGLDVTGTTMADPGSARFGTGNHDIFNETAVCVSRNLFGGTAFPERETDHSGSQFCCLWAVDCSSLSGFDTEGQQLALGESNQWRPGEKAFPAIPRSNLIAWVPVRRRGAPAGGGWRFEITPDAAWQFVGKCTVEQRVDVEDELAAWRGRHTIAPTMDFAAGL